MTYGGSGDFEYLEQAGELVLEADCLSRAALKLACLLSSLLKFLQISMPVSVNFSSFLVLHLALCRAGLAVLDLSRGESGGSGERGGPTTGIGSSGMERVLSGSTSSS